MKSKVIVGLFIFLVGTYGMALHAQSAVFSKKAEAYSNLTAATQIAKDSVWDELDQWKTADRTLNLGFNFNAYGKSFNSVFVEQGAVYFKQVDTVVFFGLFADLCDYGFGTKTPKSPISYKKEGTAGNYVVKIEWKAFGFYDDWYLNSSCKDSAHLQLWIFENPQKIELHFGPRNIADFKALFPDKLSVWCARYDAAGNTQGIVLDGAAINPTTFPYADTGTRGLTGWPVANQVYAFTFSTASNADMAQNTMNFWVNQRQLMGNNLENGNARVFALDGRELASYQITNRSIQIGQNIPAGLYIIEVINTQGMRLSKKVYINE